MLPTDREDSTRGRRTYRRRTLEDRFWSKVDRSGECWIWTGSHDKKGYGRINVDRGAIRLAHRVSWMLAFGFVADDVCVLHRCDNPPCVRPEHLFLGTVIDNNADKQAKGRQPRGDSHYASKLNSGQRDAVLRAYEPGKRGYITLAKEFGVSVGVIRNAIAQSRLPEGV